MPLIRIDGVEYEVEAGRNLLQGCLELGLDLPYFCWHPALGSVGACRQCAVVQYSNEEDSRGRIVMGCMTPVTDGAIFSLSADKAAGFREAIVESLMLNHPHDCPVCAEGGECHLQDMTVMVGHRDRRYRGRKNTHRNQYLGPLIHHEMNRCITCYRCTRYYRDYAGGTDLAAMAAHDHIYFGRHEEGTLQSPFAGNLVEVCPTGVFTDKALVQEYTRKWDLQSAPSVCVGCALGCNTLPGERYGKLKRIHNRYNHEVNGYFLCDRGRFGGQFVNSESRMNHAGTRDQNGSFRAIDSQRALELAVQHCRSDRIAGIGSPRASLEANASLQQLVGAENFCSGMADPEHELVQRALAHLASTPAHIPSLREVESADAVLVVGEDVTHTAPRLALALRQAVRNRAYGMAAELKLETWQDAAIRNLAQDQLSPLHLVCAGSSDLADIASSAHYLPDADQTLFADRILAAISGQSTADSAAEAIATHLGTATRPLIVVGTAGGNAALLDRAAAIATALAGQGAMLSICLPECNSLGAALLTRKAHQNFQQLAQRAAAGAIDTLIILENDIQRRADTATIDRLRENATTIIGLDCVETATLSECDLVLPAAAFTESEATLVSAEGRAQRSFPVQPLAADRRESWRWLQSIRTCRDSGAADAVHFDGLLASIVADHPELAGIETCAPDHNWRSTGLKVPRQTQRYSGRTAMRADVSVHEPKQPPSPDTPLAYSMEGASKPDQPGALLSYVWSPGWNSNQSLHKFQSEVGGSLRGGTVGTRLLEDLQLQTPPPQPSPAPFESRHSAFQLHPRQRVFGSDELSNLCPRIQTMAGEAFISLHPGDADRLNVADGDGVQLCRQAFEVHIDANMPPGCVGYSAGFDPCLQLQPGQWTPLSKAVDWQRRHTELIGSDRSDHRD